MPEEYTIYGVLLNFDNNKLKLKSKNKMLPKSIWMLNKKRKKKKKKTFYSHDIHRINRVDLESFSSIFTSI